jgi:hypothetical protein
MYIIRGGSGLIVLGSGFILQARAFYGLEKFTYKVGIKFGSGLLNT